MSASSILNGFQQILLNEANKPHSEITFPTQWIPFAHSAAKNGSVEKSREVAFGKSPFPILDCYTRDELPYLHFLKRCPFYLVGFFINKVDSWYEQSLLSRGQCINEAEWSHYLKQQLGKGYSPLAILLPPLLLPGLRYIMEKEVWRDECWARASRTSSIFLIHSIFPFPNPFSRSRDLGEKEGGEHSTWYLRCWEVLVQPWLSKLFHGMGWWWSKQL